MRARILTAAVPRLPLGRVARGLAVVGIGTALGQGSVVLAAPLLARLYDPADFGLLSVYAAMLSVLLAVASLRYDAAIPIATDPSEAVHLLALSVLLALIASLVLGLAVIVWGAQIATALGAPPLASLLWLLPVALFVASVAQALSSLAVYHRSFAPLGRMRAIQGLAQAIGQAAFGIVHAGPLGLIAGDVAGRTFGMEQLIRSLSGTLRSTHLSRTAIGRSARERWGFARVMTAASVLNMVSLQAPFLLIPALFNLGSAGQFFLAYRVLVLPASLVAAAVSQVFFGEAAVRRQDPTKLRNLAYDVAVSLLVFSIPTYAIVMVAGQALIVTVFGPQWQAAGLYAQILAPSLILWAVASPISALLLIGRRERESLAFTAADLAVRAVSLAIGAALGSLVIGIAILSTVDFLLNGASLWRFLRVARVSLRELVRPAGRIVLLTAPFLVLVAVAGLVVPERAPIVAIVGWLLAIGLVARRSPEPRALLSGAHD